VNASGNTDPKPRGSTLSLSSRQTFFKELLSGDGAELSVISAAQPAEFFLKLVTLPDQPKSQAPKAKDVKRKTVTEKPSSKKPLSLVETSEPIPSDSAADVAQRDRQSRRSWSSRLSQGLSKTRSRLVSQISGLLSTGKKLDAEALEDIENELLSADVGLEATDRIINRLKELVSNSDSTFDESALYDALTAEMCSILDVPGENPLMQPLEHQPFVLMVVGVNGVGKTTTIGKIAKHQSDMGRKVMLAAGDTFRAAATEQLKVWGERLSIPVIAQQAGADSASVVFDAVNAAKARGVDLLIADTAGRLHTKDHLMNELKKVKRVTQKIDDLAPHAVLLVLDAGNGQNALNQAKVFHEAVSVSGIALTKLDGTARGGISFAICETLGLPLWFIGVGEQAEDLRPFNAKDFVQALLNR